MSALRGVCLAAALAAYVHGLAGSIAAGGATTSATGVLDALPDALRTIRAAAG